MRFSITREALLKPLQVVGGVVEKRQTLPVLANVLLNVESDRLTVTGTDLEVELTASIGLDGAVPGEITVPARKLMDICKALPDGAKVDVDLDGERVYIRSGKSRFALATLPAAEFPISDTVSGGYGFEIKQGELKHLIERTHFCMANQDVRYYLNGLLVDINAGVIRAVATDGHRLAVSEIEAPETGTEKRQAIVPRKGVMELYRLLEDSDANCRVQMNSNHVKLSLGEVVFTSKLIDGRFPDYERVVPKNGDKRVVAEKEAVRQVLVRTSILSNEKYRGIRLDLATNVLKATVNNPEQEEAEEELDVDYEGEGLEIGFNVSYLLDAINGVEGDKVEILLADANSSCLIWGGADDKTKYVVMPMRL